MKVPTFPCPRCGDDQDAIEVTSIGGSKQYVQASVCGCPRPRCPFCARPVGDGPDPVCTNIDCFMVGQIIPTPDMA